jgi:hypothetical protein
MRDDTKRWSARKSLAFAVGASALLWAIITSPLWAAPPAIPPSPPVVVAEGTGIDVVKSGNTYTVSAEASGSISCTDLTDDGTACQANTGTSGHTLPFLDGANTWSTTQTFTLAPVFTAQSGTRTALGATTVGSNLFTATDASAARGFLSLGTAATQNTGTSGANVPLLNGANTWGAAQRNSMATLTPAATTFTPDFNSGQDFYAQLTAAGMTLANPSTTPVAGQKGVIHFQQDGTGSRTVSTWGSSYKCPGGCTSMPFSTGAGVIDTYSYAVINSTTIVLTPAAMNVQ